MKSSDRRLFLSSSIWVLCLAAFLLSSMTRPAARYIQTHREYQIKAAFLYNFAAFVTWPKSSFATTEAPLVIGISGTDPFGNFIDALVENEVVRGHPVVVRRITTTEELQHCHIVYVSARNGDAMRRVIALLKNKPVLTVSDAADFTKAGGMIQFYTENNRIRLRVNVKAASVANLTISAQLLKVADIAE